MRMIIEARIVSGSGTEKVSLLADIERGDGDLKQLGLNLSEGRDLMHNVQQALVTAQTQTLVEASTQCRHCHTRTRGHERGVRSRTRGQVLTCNITDHQQSNAGSSLHSNVERGVKS